jgi:hypothetical protein
MNTPNVLVRVRADDVNYRLVLASGVVAFVAVAAIGYGLANGDAVTALGALLLLPAAALLAGIGVTESRTKTESRRAV